MKRSIVKILFYLSLMIIIIYISNYFESIGINKYISVIFTFIILMISVFSIGRLIHKWLQKRQSDDASL